MPGFNDKDFDLLSMNMDSIFKQFSGTTINRAFMAALLQKMRQMHKEIGNMIESMTPSGHGTIDPWVVLGVPKTANQEEVKKAWKKRSKEVHPDIGGTTEQQMVANVAYEVICKLRGWSK